MIENEFRFFNQIWDLLKIGTRKKILVKDSGGWSEKITGFILKTTRILPYFVFRLIYFPKIENLIQIESNFQNLSFLWFNLLNSSFEIYERLDQPFSLRKSQHKNFEIKIKKKSCQDAEKGPVKNFSDRESFEAKPTKEFDFFLLDFFHFIEFLSL